MGMGRKGRFGIGRSEFTYFVAFVSEEFSGHRHRNDVIIRKGYIVNGGDIDEIEKALAIKYKASRIVILNWKLLEQK